MWAAYSCLILAAFSLLFFINYRKLKASHSSNSVTSVGAVNAMADNQENSQHVRSINNVVPGVDLTPDDPLYATFEQYRYFSGVRYDQKSLDKIVREMLDPETPSSLPDPPSKASIIVEGVDQTPDDPNWATFYEYRYDKNGVRELEPRYIKKPREGVNVEVKFTATMKVPGAPTRKMASTTTRKVVRKVALNPDHPQFANLKDQSTHDIIQTTKFSIPAEFAPSYGAEGPDKAQQLTTGMPAGTLTITQSTEEDPTTTTQTTASPPTKTQTSSPPALTPSVRLKMGRNKKNTIYKKGNCHKCSTIVLSQACRVHKAVLDSKEYVEDLLFLINSRFEDLLDLRLTWEEYDRKTVKELCPTCSAFHGRGLTKNAFQRDHVFLIDSFYHTVVDLKERVKYELDGVVADKEDLQNIIQAARTLAADRGEDSDGEMHILGEELSELYDAEIEALSLAEEEYKRDRPFFHLDEYREPHMMPKELHKSFRPGAEVADDTHIKQAALEAELKQKKAEAVEQEEEIRIEKEKIAAEDASLKEGGGIGAAQKRCEERSFRRLEEKIRMKKWQDEATKIKLRALVEGGMEDEMEEEEDGFGGVGGVHWWMRLAREELKRETGRDDLFGSTLTWKMLNGRTGMSVSAEFGGVGLEDLEVDEAEVD